MIWLKSFECCGDNLTQKFNFNQMCLSFNMSAYDPNDNITTGVAVSGGKQLSTY